VKQPPKEVAGSGALPTAVVILKLNFQNTNLRENSMLTRNATNVSYVLLSKNDMKQIKGGITCTTTVRDADGNATYTMSGECSDSNPDVCESSGGTYCRSFLIYADSGSSCGTTCS
jgi:hypothetical protein